MPPQLQEKEVGNDIHQETYEGEELEQIVTVYDDNFHGLHLSTALVFLALCICYVVQIYILVVGGVFARTVAAAVGAPSYKGVWLGQSISIVTASLGPPCCRAADLWGRKWPIVGSSIFGFIGGIIVARANSMSQVIAGQTIMSIFFGAQPLLHAVASEILPRKWRPSAQGLLYVSASIGGIVAFLGGQTLVDDGPDGWRNVWYTAAAMLGASGVIIAVLYRPLPLPLQKSLTVKQKLGRFDWTGIVLFAAAMTLIAMGLSWAEAPFPWSDAHVIACLVVGVVLAIALIVHQTLFEKHGLFDHDLFKKDFTFAIAAFGSFLDGVIFWAYNAYTPFQASIIWPTGDAITEGARNCMIFFTAIIFSALISIMGRFTKSIRVPIVISFLIFILFFGLMSGIGLHDFNASWGYLVILGSGFGWSLPFIMTVAQLLTPAHLITTTSAILLSVRSLGSSTGLGIYNAIFNSLLNDKLVSNIAPAVVPLGLPPSSLEAFIGGLAGNSPPAAIAAIPGVTPEIIGVGITALKTAYMQSFKRVYVAAAVLSAVGAI
ncbi:hypothetical protein LTS18_009553, partial [Coniosporium uncinatum]